MSDVEQSVEIVGGQPFHEGEYLAMNADVRAAVASGALASGRLHFEAFGITEGRLGRFPDRLHDFFGDQRVDLLQFTAFRAESFPYAGPHPWLDRPEWRDLVNARVDRGEVTPAEADVCRFWAENGYVILEKLIDEQTLDESWAAYERTIAGGAITLSVDPAGENDPWPGRYLDPHVKTPEICAIMRHPAVLRWVRLLMDREPAPFQTIASHKGSQQAAHSDSIHMTTYPLGYLTAAWVAFEDIHPDSGPLMYYPGSHRLPYYFSKDVGIDSGEFMQSGYNVVAEKYEPFIRDLVRKHHCDVKHFHAKKGDVFIWHANLLHGGSMRRDLRHSRRALVSHYFVKGAVTYHDLSGNLAQPHSGTCLLGDAR